MTHTDLIARLRVKDRPLMQQGNFSSIRLAIREAADALTAAQERIEALEEVLQDLIAEADRVHYELPGGQDWNLSRVLANARAALAGNQDEPA